MNRITIMRKNEEVFKLESSFIPNIGEFIWFQKELNTTLSDAVDNTEYYKVTGRVIDLDKPRKRFNVTLLVE